MLVYVGIFEWFSISWLRLQKRKKPRQMLPGPRKAKEYLGGR